VRVLAIDTATPYLVFGTSDAELALRADRRHSALLVPTLESFLERAGLRREDFQAVAAGQGPGSYTGLRVGLAFGQGLARALGVPFIGVDTLDAVAARTKAKGPVAAGLSARNRLVYAALYVNGRRLKGPFKLSAEEFRNLAPCRLLDAPPSGRALAALAERAIAEGHRGYTPHYL